MWNDEISDWELPPTTHPSVYLGFEYEEEDFESEEEETEYEPSDWELMNEFYRRVGK